jgi:hypothetical protein
MGNLKKSEKILLVGLLIVALVFVWDRMNGAKHKPAAKAAKAVAAVKKKVPLPVSAASAGGSEADSFRVIPTSALERFAVWGRDPFLGANRLAPEDTTVQDSTVLVWHGTAWKNGEAIAIIGPYVLREGEREGDVQLLKIERDYVICRYKGKKITLFRHQSDVSY